MFSNDLLQTQLSMGAYAGGMNPFNSPYTSLQTGGPNYGATGQQQQLQQLQQIQQLQQQLQQLQQLASILASQGTGQSNPWQNQLVNPILAQQLAQAGSAYGQQPQYGQQFGSPFGQQQYNSPFAQNPFAQNPYQLAPQSWVGQAGPFGGQPIPGQIQPHHLQHLAGRGLY